MPRRFRIRKRQMRKLVWIAISTLAVFAMVLFTIAPSLSA